MGQFQRCYKSRAHPQRHRYNICCSLRSIKRCVHLRFSLFKGTILFQEVKHRLTCYQTCTSQVGSTQMRSPRSVPSCTIPWPLGLDRGRKWYCSQLTLSHQAFNALRSSRICWCTSTMISVPLKTFCSSRRVGWIVYTSCQVLSWTARRTWI